jgi:small subunit ribosomal protein S6
VGVREYEIMLILPADAEESGVDGVIGRISTVLADKGGELGKVDRWGRRRLAFEIARQSEGYYAVVEFTASPEALKELDRVLSLADDVLRFKVVVRAA